MQTLSPALDTAGRSTPRRRISDEFRAAIIRNHRALFVAANAFVKLPALVAQVPNESLHVMTAGDDETRMVIHAVLNDGYPPIECRYSRDFIPVNPNLSELFAERVLSDLAASSRSPEGQFG